MVTELYCPHVLDFSRLQALENQSRSFLGQSKAEMEMIEKLKKEQLNLAGKRANLRDRLEHMRKKGPSEVAMNAADLREALSKVEAEIRNNEAASSEAEARRAAVFEKFSATEHLIKHCKGFVAKLTETAEE